MSAHPEDTDTSAAATAHPLACYQAEIARMAALAPLIGGAIADRRSYETLYGAAIVCSIVAPGVMWTRVGRAVPRAAAAC